MSQTVLSKEGLIIQVVGKGEDARVEFDGKGSLTIEEGIQLVKKLLVAIHDANSHIRSG